MSRSFLDNDLYKFTMGEAVLRKYPNTFVEYNLFIRGDHKFNKKFFEKLRNKIDDMVSVKMTDEQKIWCQHKLPFLSQGYIDFLYGYRFNPGEISLSYIENKQSILLTVRGWWHRTILWEVVLMSIISETYYEECDHDQTALITFEENDKLMREKYLKIESGFKHHTSKYSDFGTRRRYSYQNQYMFNNIHKDNAFYAGTSNMDIAMKLDTKAIGTQAHEWFMFHGAYYGYRQANKLALDNWVDVYNGSLGIALTDTYTTDNFFSVFDTKYAKLFDGVRHDSGCPFAFATRTIEHYSDLMIDPHSKTIVFSDGLTTDLAIELENTFGGEINTSFGIGTHFTNDVGLPSMNIVIKLTKIITDSITNSYYNCVKLSDNSGKHTGEDDEIDLCKRTLGLSDG